MNHDPEIAADFDLGTVPAEIPTPATVTANRQDLADPDMTGPLPNDLRGLLALLTRLDNRADAGTIAGLGATPAWKKRRSEVAKLAFDMQQGLPVMHLGGNEQAAQSSTHPGNAVRAQEAREARLAKLNSKIAL
jgi:hypothetical protein